MPRVTERVARKDYPQQGIKKGEKYYHWAIKLTYGGRVCRSKTYPRPSQLNLGFAGQIGDIEQAIGDAGSADDLRSIAEDIRSLGEEQLEKFENMPEGLQQGDTGQLLEERASQCEEWADAIESACDEYDSKIEEIEKARQEWEAYDDSLAGDDGPEAADRHEEPDEERPTESAEADALSELVDECSSAAAF